MSAEIIMKATQSDLPDIMQLWAECFPEDVETGFIPWYFRTNFVADRSWLLRSAEGELLAMLFAPDVKVSLRGKEFAVPYIQGVATTARARGNGFANRLLTAAETELSALGYPFAVLKPFDVEFYTMGGWRVLNRVCEERIPAARSAKSVEGWEFIAPRGYKTGVAEMQRIYAEWVKNADLGFYVPRDTEHWLRLLIDHRRDGGRILLASEGGIVKSFALYFMKDEEVYVRELIYGDLASAEALLSGLKKRAGNRELVLQRPDGVPLFTEIKEREPLTMVRLLNVPAAVKFCGVKVPSAFVLEDAILTYNSGCWQMDEAGDVLTKVSRASMDEQAGLVKITLPQLTDICLGCYSPDAGQDIEDEELARIYREEKPVNACFDELFI